MTDCRAEFDAEVTVLNGGGLQAQRFRLDIPSPDVSEPAPYLTVEGARCRHFRRSPGSASRPGLQ